MIKDQCSQFEVVHWEVFFGNPEKTIRSWRPYFNAKFKVPVSPYHENGPLVNHRNICSTILLPLVLNLSFYSL